MEWHPSRFFRSSGSPSPYALLVLNQPINEKAFGVLSRHASYILCADGGANRLFDMTKSNESEPELPDAIIGDLDSIRPTVQKHYEKLGVSVIKDPDQYSTDFTKCLKYLNTRAAEIIASPREGAKPPTKSTTNGAVEIISTPSFEESPLEIVILGGLGGRVDQAFSQVHHLYMMTQTQRSIREQGPESSSANSQKGSGGNLYLVSEESITFIIQTGKNTIYTPATRRADIASEMRTSQKRKRNSEQAQESERKEEHDRDHRSEAEYFFEENIGIIPLSAPAKITTHGFEWDVEDWHTEIGGQLSTSNHIRADKVEVETSVPVLFTVELAERFKR